MVPRSPNLNFIIRTVLLSVRKNNHNLDCASELRPLAIPSSQFDVHLKEYASHAPFLNASNIYAVTFLVKY